MTRRVLAVLFVAVGAALAVAVTRAPAGKDDPPADAGAKAIADEAMAKLKIDDEAGFHSALAAHGLNPNKEALDLLKMFRKGFRTRFGTPLGQTELVLREMIGTSIARLTYLERYEHAASPWQITFYRENDGWRVSHLSWGGEPGPLFRPFGG